MAERESASSKKGEKPIAAFVVKVGKRELLRIQADLFCAGSHTRCDLALDDPVVAPEHFRVRWREGRFFLEDAGSATGTYLNGLLVDGRAALKEKDEIVAGVTRLSVLGTREESGPVLALGLRARAFRFIEAGPKSSTEDKLRNDRDLWARNEVLIGRLRPLRPLNVAAGAACLILVAALVVVGFRHWLFEPGPLCRSHASLFASVRPENVTEERYAIAQKESCSACHSPFGGTPVSRCARCHGDLLRNQHPFKDAPTDAPIAGRTRRALVDEDCLLCHQEHLGTDPRAGLLPPVESVSGFCTECHAGTELERQNFATARPAVEVLQRERPHSAFAFGHDDHVGLKNTEKDELILCNVCHAFDSAVQLASAQGSVALPRDLKDFQRVPFETCARCHVERSDGSTAGFGLDESLRGFWAQKKDAAAKFVNRWRVGWHGSENAQGTCLTCHEKPFEQPFLIVPRVDVPPAQFAAAKARFALERRPHEAQFAPGAACDDCHRRGATLAARPKTEGIFWHAMHVEALESDDAEARRQISAQCAACHADRAASRTLTNASTQGVYSFAPTSCSETCHREKTAGGDRALQPVALPSAVKFEAVSRVEFPHAAHASFQADGPLADGCFSCHTFTQVPGRPSYERIVSTKAPARRCLPCHEKHDAIAGGSCRKCHSMTPEGTYSVYLGPNPPADRPLPKRQWPEPTTFTHLSAGHFAVACEKCHDAGALGKSDTLANVPIPNEGQSGCRECHLAQRKRFHWR